MAGTGSRLIRIKNDTAPERRLALPTQQAEAGTGSRIVKTTKDTAPVAGNVKQEKKLVNTKKKSLEV